MGFIRLMTCFFVLFGFNAHAVETKIPYRAGFACLQAVGNSELPSGRVQFDLDIGQVGFLSESRNDEKGMYVLTESAPYFIARSAGRVVETDGHKFETYSIKVPGAQSPVKVALSDQGTFTFTATSPSDEAIMPVDALDEKTPALLKKQLSLVTAKAPEHIKIHVEQSRSKDDGTAKYGREACKSMLDAIEICLKEQINFDDGKSDFRSELLEFKAQLQEALSGPKAAKQKSAGSGKTN